MDRQVNANTSIGTSGSVNIQKLTASKVGNAIKSTQIMTHAQNDKVGYENTQSSIQIFLKAFKETPLCTQAMKDVIDCLDMSKRFGNIRQLCNVESAELPQMISENLIMSNKFSSEIFKEIKQYYKTITNEEDKKLIVEFAKAYDAFLSIRDINNGIFKQLKLIMSYMMQPAQREFSHIIDDYYLGKDYKKINQNMKMIKQKILPYLNKYIQHTGDFGKIRRYISVLVHNTARFELSRPGYVESLISKLLGLPSFSKQTDIISAKILLQQMTQERAKDRSTDNQQAIKQMILSGMHQNTDTQNINTLLKSLILSNSTYIPIANMLLLISRQGRFHSFQVYFEEQEEMCYKVIFFANIEQLGDVECIIIFTKQAVTVEVYGPSLLVENKSIAIQQIENILKQNKLNCQKIIVDVFDKNKGMPLIFEKNRDGRRGVYGEV